MEQNTEQAGAVARKRRAPAITHEAYVRAVAALAAERESLTDSDRAALTRAKLVYGAGRSDAYGVTYFRRWRLEGGASDAPPEPIVELCALTQASLGQLALTTIHELGHVLAGHEAGHGPAWRAACERLGLRLARAVEPLAHCPAKLEPTLRYRIASLATPNDGAPVNGSRGFGYGPPLIGPRGGRGGSCPTSWGTRGGRSRGPGSGSRLRRYTCACDPVIIIYAGRDDLNATCGACNAAFTYNPARRKRAN